MSLYPYRNEPYVDFAQLGPAESMRAALASIRGELGRHYPLLIRGERVQTEGRVVSVNPAKPSEVVGQTSKCTRELADKAVRGAHEEFLTWGRTDPDHRARILLRAAHMLRRRIYEVSALMVFEVSKSWIEAYADAAEAVDFLEYYAREMMRLSGSQPVVPHPGEECELRYIPLGVVAVISPWNFPLAIMAGMTAAAVVTGNTVVLKPASTAPIIAAKFLQLMHDAGLPKEVVSFVPGSGSEVGDLMVDHPLTRAVAFTGSKEVGLRIHERAAKTNPGQIWIKRTILEMGGKDFVAVDEDADPVFAAEEAVASAFGFQGQKCSAGSRLIVHAKRYDEVLEEVRSRVPKLTVGDTTEENHYMGAVIDAKAQQSIQSYIEFGKSEGELLVQGPHPGGEGYFVPPTVFCGVPPHARIAQEEIFGPVLAVIRAESFDEIIQIANGTEYGLTGALISNSRAHLERGRQELHCGNLYLNRKCTGALVGVQPFGGFNMSGTNSKAGGPDYLGLFLQGKSITERF